MLAFVASGQGERVRATGLQRLALLAFFALLLLLFAVLAVAEGVGDPSIPSEDIILIEDTPGDSGEISKAEFDHALFLTANESGLAKAPRPGDKRYEEIKEAALTGLIEPVWVEGEAAEMGIEVSGSEVTKELNKLLKENFQRKRSAGVLSQNRNSARGTSSAR